MPSNLNQTMSPAVFNASRWALYSASVLFISPGFQAAERYTAGAEPPRISLVVPAGTTRPDADTLDADMLAVLGQVHALVMRPLQTNPPAIAASADESMRALAISRWSGSRSMPPNWKCSSSGFAGAAAARERVQRRAARWCDQA